MIIGENGKVFKRTAMAASVLNQRVVSTDVLSVC